MEDNYCKVLRMKKLRIIARVLTIHQAQLLLVRNKGAKFWYPPGGGWEYENEVIKECAAREVAEETGYHVDIKNLLWVQEFREGDNVYFETFWHGELAMANKQDDIGLESHVDLDENGAVEEARWFTEADLIDMRVFPERAKTFMSSIAKIQPDPFIGSK